MKVKSEDIKNYCNVAFSVLLIVLVVRYMFFDWDEIEDEISEAMEELSDTLTCEVKCGDFSFNGLCVDTEEIFNFMINQSVCGD